jgi:hypothetical protein
MEAGKMISRISLKPFKSRAILLTLLIALCLPLAGWADEGPTAADV